MRRIAVTITPRVTTSVVLKTGVQGLQGAQGVKGDTGITDASLLTSGTVADARLSSSVVLTGDARLSDARTPTAHTHAVSDVTGLQAALDGKQASGSYAPAAGIAPSSITGTAVITTDTRLSDARTPTAHTHTRSQITDFPTLATVATSGSYADLSNKPSIPAATTDASLLTSGTLSDSRLSDNVSLDNINNNFSASQTFAGSANTAPNQGTVSTNGLIFPSSDASLITNSLFKNQFLNFWSSQIEVGILTPTFSTGGSTQSQTVVNGGYRNIRFNTGTANPSYVVAVLDAQNDDIFGGNTAFPFNSWFNITVTPTTLGVGDYAMVGHYNPAAPTTMAMSSNDSTQLFTSIGNLNNDCRWAIQIKNNGSTNLQIRALTMTAAGVYASTSYQDTGLAVGGKHESALMIWFRVVPYGTVSAYWQTLGNVPNLSTANRLLNAVNLGGASYPQNYRISTVSTSGVAAQATFNNPKMILVS